MGIKNRVLIAQALLRAGRSPEEPVAFVQNGSTPRELVIESTLKQVACGEVIVSNPAVFVVGEVVRLRRSLTAAPQPAPASEAEP